MHARANNQIFTGSIIRRQSRRSQNIMIKKHSLSLLHFFITVLFFTNLPRLVHGIVKIRVFVRKHNSGKRARFGSLPVSSATRCLRSAFLNILPKITSTITSIVILISRTQQYKTTRILDLHEYDDFDIFFLFSNRS